ncbi:MAG: SMP-30/gluconolactonase/LRE family protein [Alteraurantiacibacter sp.]
MVISPLEVPKCSVGEGPVWDERHQALYWIDIVGRKVFRLLLASSDVAQWNVPEMIGSMAIRQDGKSALVALASGVHTLDFTTGECTLLATRSDLNDQVQLADGKVDRRGRFIVGSSDRSMKEGRGKIYVLDPGANELRAIDDGVILANGPCWSPDDRTFYHADSVRQMIFAYDYDIETGTVSGKREFANIKKYGGIPDGATVDAEGHLWSAICEAGKLVRFSPDGNVERIVEFPQKTPGSLMFGGPELDRLFVPTLNPAAVFPDREGHPDDGLTFAIDGMGIKGIAEPRFGA